jgi:hypothetical protein
VAAIPERRDWVEIRGIYGGVPTQIFDRGETLADYGVNAVWIGSGGLTDEGIQLLHSQGAHVFAEFNTLHEASYLIDHPDAAPVGEDGMRCPAPDGWQGVCPSHPGYRENRMAEFRRVLSNFEIDGVWLDYHHSHASWEQAEPNMPDTCFCPNCLERFEQETGCVLPDITVPEIADLLLSERREEWTAWRCGLLTDWVREFRAILNQVRPAAVLGTFHNPWSDTDFDGARLEKLAIDLRAQAAHLDVFSIMPYHARFGHGADPGWVHRQTAWLGEYLGISGRPEDRNRIWPIVQLSDWGETVNVEQVEAVLDYGSRRPATGVIAFVWSTLHPHWDRVSRMGEVYRRMA